MLNDEFCAKLLKMPPCHSVLNIEYALKELKLIERRMNVLALRSYLPTYLGMQGCGM